MLLKVVEKAVNILSKKLETYLKELRKIEEHRNTQTEKKIRALYKQMLNETRAFLSETYERLAQEDKLTYALLQQQNEYARFLEEVAQKLSGVSKETSREIMKAVKETYKNSYEGMVKAVKSSANNKELNAKLSTIQNATAETIKAAVNNPVSGLTLSDTLEKYRQGIIYDIKQNIGVGLINGDRYTTMAKRIAESLDGDYKKAIRITRTETHRVREAGFLDAANEVDSTLQNGKTNLRMIKTWKTMKDARVRTGQADHVQMEGVQVLADEDFTLSDGNKTQAPGQSGIAAQDINCRCYVSYDLKEPETLKLER